MKKLRQEKMLDLISRYEIDTQEELIRRLCESGFEVTQATISRDIRELKITKMSTGHGTYRYVRSKPSEVPPGMKFNATLVDSIVSVDYACNMVVIKTFPGLANAVAVGIDSMNLPQILGCVAGDDAIMIVSRDENCAKSITERFQEMSKQV